MNKQILSDPYTKATNCTDIDDVQAGINSLLRIRGDKQTTKLWRSRLASLCAKGDRLGGGYKLQITSL